MTITPCRPKWKGTMTDRERFNRQMHYQPVDRCFNMEFGYWDENFKQWPIFVENGITNNAEADVFFNFDRTETHRRHHLAATRRSRTRWSRRRETTRIIMNGDGLLAEVPKDGHDTIPHYIKASIVTPEDWKRCKEERFRRDDPARKVDVEALKRQHPADRDYPLGVWCGSMIGKIRDMLTFEGLAYAMLRLPRDGRGHGRDRLPAWWRTSSTRCCRTSTSTTPPAGRTSASRTARSCRSISSRNVVMPRYKRIAQKLQGAGIDLWYTDCDGDVRPHPAGLPGGRHATACSPSRSTAARTRPSCSSKYGKDLRIMGGVDKIEMGKGPAAIKAYLETLVPLVERGGYIPFCDHRCPPNVKPEDYLYYLDLKEQMFGLKAQGWVRSA